MKYSFRLPIMLSVILVLALQVVSAQQNPDAKIDSNEKTEEAAKKPSSSDIKKLTSQTLPNTSTGNTENIGSNKSNSEDDGQKKYSSKVLKTGSKGETNKSQAQKAKFQKKNNLKTDGAVGPKTMDQHNTIKKNLSTIGHESSTGVKQKDKKINN